MTNYELDEKMAVLCNITLETDSDGSVWYKDSLAPWQPTRDMNQALEVVEALAAKGYDWSVDVLAETGLVWTYFGKRRHSSVGEAECNKLSLLPRAICEAAMEKRNDVENSDVDA